MLRKISFLFVAISWICITPAFAQVPSLVKEDLAVCTLPHGEIVLPDRNLAEAASGLILDFSEGKLKAMPQADSPPASAAAFLKLIRDADAGDLIFSRNNGGTLLAISTRISDLRSSLLSDHGGKALAEPPPVESKEERDAAGRGTPGAIENIAPQHTYLLQTVEGKYALLRVIQIEGDEATVQFVFQPDGTRTFAVPKGKTISVEPAAIEENANNMFTPAVQAKIAEIGSFLEARQQFIAKLIEAVRAPATTMDQRYSKALAIRALGQLRSEQAVPALVAEVLFRSEFEVSREVTLESQYPAVSALAHIGKHSSNAAIDALTATPRIDETDSQLKVRLLVEVVKRIEGLEVGKFMLEKRLARAVPEERDALRNALDWIGK